MSLFGHTLMFVFGLTSGNSWTYLLWSGFGGFLEGAGAFGVFVTVYRHRTCHVDGCWRLGRHPVEGMPYTVCRRHHPDVPARVTYEHVMGG